MGLWSWPSTMLKGQQQSIPRICPNCLAPTTVSYRYGYRSAFWFFSRTTYYQTFYYCAGCEPMMDAWLKWRKWGGWMFLFTIFAVGGGAAAGAALAKGTGAAVGAIVLGVGIWVLFFSLRARDKGKLTKRPEQAVEWGAAAYYTGDSFFSLGFSQVYKAAREEWIRELVKRNPEAVTDAEYLRVLGEPKPAPAPDQKPFAG